MAFTAIMGLNALPLAVVIKARETDVAHLHRPFAGSRGAERLSA